MCNFNFSLDKTIESETQVCMESTIENVDLAIIEDLPISDAKKTKNIKHSKRKIILSESEDSMTGEKNNKDEDEVTFRITRKRFKMNNSGELNESDTKTVKEM